AITAVAAIVTGVAAALPATTGAGMRGTRLVVAIATPVTVASPITVTATPVAAAILHLGHALLDPRRCGFRHGKPRRRKWQGKHHCRRTHTGNDLEHRILLMVRQF